MDDESVMSLLFIAPGGFDNIKITVWQNEGYGYPHFHFYRGLDPNKSVKHIDLKNGGGCICFMEEKYFVHSGHTDRMSRKEISHLKKWLNKTVDGSDTFTNWNSLINAWNANNQRKIPVDLSIPDYYYNMPNYNE